MRFRPANIRLINRRSILPRLLLALSSKEETNNDNDNNNNPTDVQRLTGSPPARRPVPRSQLEIRQHARERRAELVRGVGDELTLAVEHRLGVRPGGVERAEHPLERPGGLGHLVVGLGTGETAARVPRALDLTRRLGQRGDRPDRTSSGSFSPAGSASTVPPSTPSNRKNCTRASVWSRSDSGRAYSTEHLANRLHAVLAHHDPVPGRLIGAGLGRSPERRGDGRGLAP